MNMQFLDSQRVLDEHGWIVRLRRKGGADDGELTFKRRFHVENDAVDAAWQRARDANFVGADRFRRQLEWSRHGRTLSFSREKSFQWSHRDELGLPDLRQSVEIVLDELPGRLRALVIDGQSVEDRLRRGACLYGPVRGIRWFGTWHEEEAWIERWDIPTSSSGVGTVVEVSFVKADYFEALELRHILAEYLDARGWLHRRDDLKTKLILEAFTPGCAAAASTRG